MSQKKQTGSGSSETGRMVRWQQPWMKRVLQGKYSGIEKLIYDRVESFPSGECKMRNRTFMDELGYAESTIRAAIAHLWRGGEFLITGWDTHKRRIYAINSPQGQAALSKRFKEEKESVGATDKDDFLAKIKARGYPVKQTNSGLTNEKEGMQPARPVAGTRQTCSGYPPDIQRVPARPVAGNPPDLQRVHKRESRERIEGEQRHPDLSLAGQGQPNPAAETEEKEKRHGLLKAAFAERRAKNDNKAAVQPEGTEAGTAAGVAASTGPEKVRTETVGKKSEEHEKSSKRPATKREIDRERARQKKALLHSKGAK